MNWLEILLLSVEIAAGKTEGPVGPRPKPLPRLYTGIKSHVQLKSVNKAKRAEAFGFCWG